MSSTRNISTAERSVPGAPSPGQVLAGKYVVQDIVGSGGMGVVVSARHQQLGQIVALKLLLADEQDEKIRNESQARFLREAQAAAQLRSDHVVRIYDVGTLDSGAPFMVMELLHGADLASLLEQAGTLPIATAVDYVTQACHAVAAAHAAGIVHRDLKPSNLFLTERSDGTALVKVLDFGISKTLSATGELQASLTSTKSVVGSPYYMSPEQVRDAKRVDARADIWALGMILYELLAGRPAFEADTLPGICAAIAADTPQPVRTFRPEVPPALEAIIMSCLEKSPARRPQSVEELAYALLPFAPRVSSSLRDLQPSLTTRALDQRSVSPDAATISAPSQDQADHSGMRASPQRPSGADRTDRTMASADLQSSTAPPRRRWGVPAALVATMAIGGILLASKLGSQAPDPVAPPTLSAATPTSPPSPGAESFRAFFQSEPPGAEVREGGVGLGRTPLALQLERESFASGPRVFTLERDGFRSFSHSQSASDVDVEIKAVLVPLEAPPPPVNSSAPEPAAERRPAAVRTPSKPPAREPRPPATSLDIRLER